MRGLGLTGLVGLALLATGCQDNQEAAGGDSGRMTSTDELVTRLGEGIDLETHPGVELFNDNCLGCHSGAVPKAPAVLWLEMMAPDAILSAMDDGLMKQQAALNIWPEPSWPIILRLRHPRVALAMLRNLQACRQPKSVGVSIIAGLPPPR
jgi:hypothetical protein